MLTIQGTTSADQMRVEVGPTDGLVTLFGVPGVSDGTTYSGVTRFLVFGSTGDDSIEVTGSGPVNAVLDGGAGSSSIKVQVESRTSNLDIRTGPSSDSISIELATPVGGRANAAIAATTYFGDFMDLKIANNAAVFDLGLGFSDSVAAEIDRKVPSAVSVRLNGRPTTSGSDQEFKLAVKGPGSLNLDGAVVSDKISVESEGATSGNFLFTGARIDNTVDVIVKGNFNGSPRIVGGSFNDSITFLAEGTVTGSPVVDGGLGTDSCAVSVGVTRTGCE